MNRKTVTVTVSILLSAAVCSSVLQPAKADTLICRENEHKHVEECFEHVLVCQEEEREGHAHDDSCYLVEYEQICGKAEGEAHVHGEGCYEQRTSFICGMQESAGDPGHSHAASCYDEDGQLICSESERPITEGHTHTESCMQAETVLICTEDTAPHVHTDSCYKEVKTLVCQISEEPGHTHGPECYERTGVLLCTLPEHIHSVEQNCYVDVKEGMEDPESWDDFFAAFPYTGDWALDLAGIARTQIGTCESIYDVQIDQDGIRHGYTRYGHWSDLLRHGRVTASGPYELWCADFVSFCLHYAGIPQNYMPADINCQSMSDALDRRGYYYRHVVDMLGNYDYTPKTGDLVFFDFEKDGISDHMGIVIGVEQGELINGMTRPEIIIHCVEGNVKRAVRESAYSIYHAGICGFADTQKANTEHIVDSIMKIFRTGPDVSQIVTSPWGETNAVDGEVEDSVLEPSAELQTENPQESTEVSHQ